MSSLRQTGADRLGKVMAGMNEVGVRVGALGVREMTHPSGWLALRAGNVLCLILLVHVRGIVRVGIGGAEGCSIRCWCRACGTLRELLFMA